MPHNAIVNILFPPNEYDKIYNEADVKTEIKYKINNNGYNIGKVVNIHKNNENIALNIEIRKDETPYWYLKNILDAAKNSEIYFVINNLTIAKEGSITSTKYSEGIKDNDIIYPISIVITRAN